MFISFLVEPEKTTNENCVDVTKVILIADLSNYGIMEVLEGERETWKHALCAVYNFRNVYCLKIALDTGYNLLRRCLLLLQLSASFIIVIVFTSFYVVLTSSIVFQLI